jgi:hypothetical protein
MPVVNGSKGIVAPSHNRRGFVTAAADSSGLRIPGTQTNPPQQGSVRPPTVPTDPNPTGGRWTGDCGSADWGSADWGEDRGRPGATDGI